MIGRRLAADGGIQQRGPGLGEGIVALGSSLGTTVGKTVGAAVAVPEAVLTGKATALPVGSEEE